MFELDYVKDMVKNVGSKLEICVWILLFWLIYDVFIEFNIVLFYL